MIAYRYTHFLFRLKIFGYFFITLGSLAATVAAQTSSDEHFSRVIKDKVLRKTILQLPVRKFERPGKVGPVVTLQSMVHVADRSFFEQQQKLAESHEVILFEGTTMPGTGRLKYSLQNSDSAESRIALTKMRLRTLGLKAMDLKEREGKLPRSFLEMNFKRRSHDMLAKDGWGNDFQFRSDPGDQLEILSLGRDYRQGGEGEDADILLSQQDQRQASFLLQVTAMKVRVMQMQALRVLGLEFQGDVMVEEGQCWRNSDLAMDQVWERLEAVGVATDSLNKYFASFPVGMVKPLLKLVEANSSLKLAGKMVFLELLESGRPENTHESHKDGIYQVLIVDRNQVVIDDLNEIIEKEPQVKSVSIVYGGGHMPNLEMRLKEMGYQEVSVEWIDAVTVQLPKNPVDKVKMELALNFIRKMMRQVESEADQHMKRGDAAGGGENSLKEFQKAQVLFEEAVKKNPKNADELNRLAVCYDRIGLTYQVMGQWEKAFEVYGKGEKIRRSLVERYPKDLLGERNLAWSLARLAETSRELGKSKQALDFFQEGREIYRRSLAADPKNTEWKGIVSWYDEQIESAKQKE
jgi:tetratricopeptide (TPR) repeat protein